MKEISNIHSLYQDLFITDMKDEISSATKEVAALKLELIKHKKANEVLKKDNKDLKTKLDRYRDMIRDSKKENDELVWKIRDVVAEGDDYEASDLINELINKM